MRSKSYLALNYADANYYSIRGEFSRAWYDKHGGMGKQADFDKDWKAHVASKGKSVNVDEPARHENNIDSGIEGSG